MNIAHISVSVMRVHVNQNTFYHGVLEFQDVSFNLVFALLTLHVLSIRSFSEIVSVNPRIVWNIW